MKGLNIKQIRILIIFILVLIFVIFLWARFGQRGVVEVEVIEISKGEIESIVSAPGIVVSSNIEIVLSKIDGVISELKAFEGKKVKKGEILCIIENPEIKAKVIQAQINLSLAEENINKAEEEEEIAVARNRYKLAEENYKFLRDLRVISPKIDGELIDLKIKNGQAVAKGTELFKIVDMNKMELKAKVSEFDANDVKVGQKVIIGETMYKGIEFNGHVTKIGRFIEREMGTAFMEITSSIENKKDYPLKLGSYAEARIITFRKASVLKVPKEAIFVEKGNIIKVFVVEGRKAYLRTITTGISGEDYFEVVSGLKEGDMVVTKGKFNLKDGSRIRIKKKR